MKFAILLPTMIDLGLLRRVRELCSLVAEAQAIRGEAYSIAVGLPHTTDVQWRAREKYLREGNPDVVVRHLKWEPVSVENARRMFSNLPPHLDMHGIEEVVVGRDWGWNFTDCDAALVFADPALGAVLPLVPTAFYCRDLSVRIVPEAFAQSIHDPYWKRQTEAFRLWRQSTVLTSDPATVDDLVSYAGVRKERVILAPNLLAGNLGDQNTSVTRNALRLLWLVEASPLHDLHHALKGLQTYLAEGGAMRPLVIAENVTDLEAGSASVAVKELPSGLADLLYSLPKLDLASDRELFRLLLTSGVLWSSRIAGGEGEAAILAAEAGLPFVGADFPINRTQGNATGAVAQLYPLADTVGIADALHQAQDLAERREPVKPTPADPRSARVKQIGLILDRLLEPSLAR